MKLQPKAFLCKSDIGTEHLRFSQPDGVDAEPLYAIPPGYVLVNVELLDRLRHYAEMVRAADLKDEPIFADLDQVDRLLSAAKEK